MAKNRLKTVSKKDGDTMKKIKVSNRIDLASRGYRLGKINASKIVGYFVLDTDLQDVDDFALQLHWGISAPGCYWDIYTDMITGKVVSSEFYSE